MSIKIEIDCRPGSIRPDTYFNQIITILSKNSLIGIKEFGEKHMTNFPKPVSQRFGNWIWEMPLVDNEIIIKAKIINIFKEELTKYFNSGAIRCGQWD